MTSAGVKTLPAATLRRIMLRALERRGVSRQHAGYLVEGLIEASLRGTDTHGVRLFATYLAELDGGRCRARPELRWSSRRPAVRVLDAGHALGPVAGRIAAREAVHLARQHGVGAVAVRNSNYFGGCAQYTLEMARHEVIGISSTNSDALVAPVGVGRPLFGTNPLSFAVRGAGDDVFCVDMATSQVSFTKIKQHREQGIPLEPGWAVGPDGRDASRVEVTEVAALLPLGGHKGQCLVMMIEILCCLLAGMPFDHQLSHLYDEPFDQPRQTSHFFLALEITAFQPLRPFRARLSELMELVRAQRGAGGTRGIAPGDLERGTFEQRQRQGIPLTGKDLNRFQQIDEEDEPGGTCRSSAPYLG